MNFRQQRPNWTNKFLRNAALSRHIFTDGFINSPVFSCAPSSITLNFAAFSRENFCVCINSIWISTFVISTSENFVILVVPTNGASMFNPLANVNQGASIRHDGRMATNRAALNFRDILVKRC